MVVFDLDNIEVKYVEVITNDARRYTATAADCNNDLGLE